MRKNKVFFIVFTGAMSALGVILAFFIHVPIFPAVSFLEYDPADIVIYLCTYAFGIPCGLAMTAVVSIIQGVTVSASSGIIGILMHMVSTGSFVIVSGLVSSLFRKKMTAKDSSNSSKAKILMYVISVALGIIATTVMMFLWNLILTPIYMNIPRSMLFPTLIWFIVLFNIIKAGINGIMGAVLSVVLGKKLHGFTKKG